MTMMNDTERHEVSNMGQDQAEDCYSLYAHCSENLDGSPADRPWPDEWWKPAGPRRNLVKAGALILAEIERLDRAALAASTAKQGEAVEVVGYRFFHVDHGYIFRRTHIYEGNPSLEAHSLMTVAQHQRILAASVPAGCKVVPVELLERLEHVTRTLVPHLQCHVELRALLAVLEGVKDE